MADANENLDDIFEDGASVTEEAEPKQAEQEEHHDDAAPRGYMTKDAWVASGKPAGDWVSEEIFKERGYHIKQTTALKRDFENQIKNLSLLHQVQLRNQREELVSKRDDAIDVADKAAVKAFDKQIKDLDDIEKLNTPSVARANAKPAEISEWESENPWCLDQKDARTIFANRIFSEALSQGKTNAGALRAVDKEVAAKFSAKSTEPRQIAEGSRNSGNSRADSGAVTMKTLTREEQKIWEAAVWPDEKSFLKAVANYRKGEK